MNFDPWYIIVLFVTFYLELHAATLPVKIFCQTSWAGTVCYHHIILTVWLQVWAETYLHVGLSSALMNGESEYSYPDEFLLKSIWVQKKFARQSTNISISSPPPKKACSINDVTIKFNFSANQGCPGDASSIQLCLSLLKKPGACHFTWKKFSSCSCLCFEGFSPDMLVFLRVKINTNNKIEESFKWAGIRDLMPNCRARLLLVSCSVLTVSSTTNV